MRLQRAVADRDDVAGTDEDVGFAELDRIPCGCELRRAEHDEQRVVVLLDLGPLVGRMRVLDGEIVQAELPLHARQDVRARLMPPIQTNRSSCRSASLILSIDRSATRHPRNRRRS